MEKGFCAALSHGVSLPVKVLLVPHFENGAMSGDAPGEAQFFYEEYFRNGDVYSAADGTAIYYDPENKLAMCLSGVGKSNAAASVTAVLCDSRFDFSGARLIVPSCSGGAIEYATLGDVVLETAVCDYDLGHTADFRDVKESGSQNVWFASAKYDEIGCKKLNPETVGRAYALTKDLPLKTTDACRDMLARNFPGQDWAARDPAVIKGTAITSDIYWKGKYNHDKAVQITEYYHCPDPYAATEMEDLAIAVVADRFGLLDRTLILRVAVNLDVFFDGATPETLWGQSVDFIGAQSENNKETLDVFCPAMENLFLVGKTLVDSILNGTF